MVKANAYGHGDVEVARALRAAGAAHLGVGLIEEGISLRLSGDQKPLLLFGLYNEASAHAVIEFDLTSVVSQWQQLYSLLLALKKRKSDSSGRISVHLKFNTGMNRLGFAPSDAPKLREFFDSHPEFDLNGVCTHFLRGDDAGAEGGESEAQFHRFATVLRSFEGMSVTVHALNSSATANLWKRASDQKSLSADALWPVGVRPGIGLYGVQPSNDERAELPLKPVLTFKSQIVMIHQLKAGEKVSYNGTWQAKTDSVIGVVPVGYADGYFRALSNRGQVLCRGHRVSVAGTVCMDYFMIDLTGLPTSGENPVAVGEDVTLIGRQGEQEITATEVANLIGTIPYEVLTHIGERVPRVYVRSNEEDVRQK